MFVFCQVVVTVGLSESWRVWARMDPSTCQKECQNRCQIERQNICQIEYQKKSDRMSKYISHIYFQMMLCQNNVSGWRSLEWSMAWWKNRSSTDCLQGHLTGNHGLTPLNMAEILLYIYICICIYICVYIYCSIDSSSVNSFKDQLCRMN